MFELSPTVLRYECDWLFVFQYHRYDGLATHPKGSYFIKFN